MRRQGDRAPSRDKGRFTPHQWQLAARAAAGPVSKTIFRLGKGHRVMPIRSELHPGATLPDQGRAMSDAEVALGFNHTLVGFLDLPSRQGPCSDLNQVPPGRDKMSKSKSKSWSWSWSAMPELKPHFRYCRFCLWRFFLWFVGIFL